MHPDVTDGPCKVFSKDNEYCVNKAETRYCSVDEGVYTVRGRCETRVEGNIEKYW